ncbi:Spy/CpxP family protein refolding chaperone [Hyphomicrobium sp.]|uniref:Spy/CpxP family protein refolding chaperone n=1 Tax=Hyphomicrobium sp. TaxID=82 RepID=UPI0025C60758|nr:Spy/CpxP family protein refolding chaperone [Hyphomicrobium sp.]MCC7253930.1 Spy/CpxP family protein refolding chaperone [Hyphomicrobium sp.]
MTRKGKFILGGLAAATVGLVAAGAMAERGHYWEGHKGHKGRHFGHGWGGGGVMGLSFGGPNYRICRGDVGEKTDLMLVRLEHRVKPTDAQKEAFDEFKTAARAAAEKLREACPQRPERTDDGERAKRTTIDRLAQTQTGLETSLEALKTFRPAAEKFYAALSDEQKAKLDRRGRGKGHWNRDRDRGPRDKGGENERAPEAPGEPDGPAPDDKG